MVYFPPVSPPRTYTPPSPHLHAPHSQPISLFSILSPAQYWVRNTNHLAPRYAVPSIPPLPVSPRSKYSPQHHVLLSNTLSVYNKISKNNFVYIMKSVCVVAVYIICMFMLSSCWHLFVIAQNKQKITLLVKSA